MISISNKNIILDYILYINYLICKKRNNNDVEALINFRNKVNIIILAYTLKLGLQV